MTTRRNIVLKLIPSAAALAFVGRAMSAEAARLEESDSLAVALGYQHDGSKVDGKKFPTYAAGKNCAACQLYTGKVGEPWGVCSAVGGKQVNAKGWCAAWAKKA